MYGDFSFGFHQVLGVIFVYPVFEVEVGEEGLG